MNNDYLALEKVIDDSFPDDGSVSPTKMREVCHAILKVMNSESKKLNERVNLQFDTILNGLIGKDIGKNIDVIVLRGGEIESTVNSASMREKIVDLSNDKIEYDKNGFGNSENSDKDLNSNEERKWRINVIDFIIEMQKMVSATTGLESSKKAEENLNLKFEKLGNELTVRLTNRNLLDDNAKISVELHTGQNCYNKIINSLGFILVVRIDGVPYNYSFSIYSGNQIKIGDSVHKLNDQIKDEFLDLIV